MESGGKIDSGRGIGVDVLHGIKRKLKSVLSLKKLNSLGKETEYEYIEGKGNLDDGEKYHIIKHFGDFPY